MLHSAEIRLAHFETWAGTEVWLGVAVTSDSLVSETSWGTEAWLGVAATSDSLDSMIDRSFADLVGTQVIFTAPKRC